MGFPFTFKSAPAQKTLGTKLRIKTTLAEESLLISSRHCWNPLRKSFPIAFFLSGLSNLTSTIPAIKIQNPILLVSNLSNQPRHVKEVTRIVIGESVKLDKGCGRGLQDESPTSLVKPFLDVGSEFGRRKWLRCNFLLLQAVSAERLS